MLFILSVSMASLCSDCTRLNTKYIIYHVVVVVVVVVIVQH